MGKIPKMGFKIMIINILVGHPCLEDAGLLVDDKLQKWSSCWG